MSSELDGARRFSCEEQLKAELELTTQRCEELRKTLHDTKKYIATRTGTVKLLSPGGHRASDERAVEDVYAQLHNFDANLCECFVPEERERLLGIIESAFGGLHSFNEVMARTFVRHSPSAAGGAGLKRARSLIDLMRI